MQTTLLLLSFNHASDFLFCSIMFMLLTLWAMSVSVCSHFSSIFLFGSMEFPFSFFAKIKFTFNSFIYIELLSGCCSLCGSYENGCNIFLRRCKCPCFFINLITSFFNHRKMFKKLQEWLPNPNKSNYRGVSITVVTLFFFAHSIHFDYFCELKVLTKPNFKQSG